MTLSRPDDEGLAAIPADEFTALLEHENALARHQETGMMRNPCSACRDNNHYPYTVDRVPDALAGDLIEEHGQHTGHTDLLREAVDGLAGEDPPAGSHVRAGQYRPAS